VHEGSGRFGVEILMGVMDGVWCHRRQDIAVLPVGAGGMCYATSSPVWMAKTTGAVPPLLARGW
jgi:hypothetical protein